MKELKYPFNTQSILRKRRAIKKQLLNREIKYISKNVAILGGSTTHDIKEILELFLLDYGIKPNFYESEFGQYWEDAMFSNAELEELKPDIIFIHTSNRNILQYPTVNDSIDTINNMLENDFKKFQSMWDTITEKYNCIIIQNNFEMPFYRLLGNKDVSDLHGRRNYLCRLNGKMYEYAQNHQNFYINDIEYLSSNYGIEKWSDSFYWHMYKYCLNLDAIPHLAFSVANIIKSIYGKNKKSIVLDLDNTLWGGVVGDDGVDGIEIGQETSMGQVYSEFQKYIKSHKDIGVMLNINSKNDYDNAIAGMNHPEGTLKIEDFIVIKANWNNKDNNIVEIANELNILPEAMVFVDDNPVEREIVRSQISGISVPEIDKVEHYINIIDKSGFFEVTNFSDDDIKRNDMYKANIERINQQKSFDNYEDYLKSLKMTAIIKDFENIYLQRIVQLTNKSNQFNLTTKRYTQADIEDILDNENYLRLYGKLEDKFGDNGIVTVVIGKKEEDTLHIDLWLMSCRVLKRDMECAMLDRVIEEAKNMGIKTIKGYYYKTTKNNMVKDFYKKFGFEKISEYDNGDSTWKIEIENYKNKNNVIKVVK